MYIKLQLSRWIGPDMVESALRRDFSGIRIKRGITGAIKLYPRINSLVVFVFRASAVKIYASFPLNFVVLLNLVSYAYAVDEKRAAEKQYETWFREKYAHYLLREEFNSNNELERTA